MKHIALCIVLIISVFGYDMAAAQDDEIKFDRNRQLDFYLNISDKGTGAGFKLFYDLMNRESKLGFGLMITGVRGENEYLYYDPYYYRYSYYNYYYNPHYSNTYTKTEMRQFILEFDSGKVMEYTVNSVEMALMRDPELHDEYMTLSNRKKKQRKFLFIRQFNDRNPVFIPAD